MTHFNARLLVLLLLLPALGHADERPAGLRWGIALAPGLLVAAQPTHKPSTDNDTYDTHALAWGLELPIARLGYAFPSHGLVSVSLYAEPRLSLHVRSDQDIVTVLLSPAGSVVFELDVGRYFFFALGPSVGGAIAIVDGVTARGPAMGGLTLKVGSRFPLPSAGRPRSLTVALDTLALFSPSDVIDGGTGKPLSTHQQGTGSLTSIGLSIGYDAF
jgi:hypothetical protein